MCKQHIAAIGYGDSNGILSQNVSETQPCKFKTSTPCAGQYAAPIAWWLNFFPPSQFLFVHSADLRKVRSPFFALIVVMHVTVVMHGTNSCSNTFSSHAG